MANKKWCLTPAERAALPKPPRLTEAQVLALARRLRGTTNSVYQLFEAMTGCPADDAVFDDLEKRGGIFRCVECSYWQGLDQRDGVGDLLCTNCADEADGSSLDDDD